MTPCDLYSTGEGIGAWLKPWLVWRMLECSHQLHFFSCPQSTSLVPMRRYVWDKNKRPFIEGLEFDKHLNCFSFSSLNQRQDESKGIGVSERSQIEVETFTQDFRFEWWLAERNRLTLPCCMQRFESRKQCLTEPTYADVGKFTDEPSVSALEMTTNSHRERSWRLYSW